MNKEKQLKDGLDILINSFEQDLTFLHNRDMKKFDMNLMPKIIQDMVKLATSKSPSFSNISAVAVSNFVLSNLFGQLRVVINDPIYSDDALCPNTYSMLIARSGGGKTLPFKH